jgi:hypothetical protein
MNDYFFRNKTIYMTYKKPVPEIVFDRWKDLNDDYNIELSLDDDCIQFLKDHFNDYVAELFAKIPLGMYKADLWRLCKLYINSGVYADVDLIPHINIDKLDKNISFYSCLALDKKSIFQAFMVNFSKPKNPLLLQFIISFLLNNPYTYQNGPCHDMFNCILYNLNAQHIYGDKIYHIDEVKINVKIGTSCMNVKKINLFFFPNDVDYCIKLKENDENDVNENFNFIIENNYLIVTKLDETNEIGWTQSYSIDICIKANENIYLFKEYGDIEYILSCYIGLNGKKIMNSRDRTYYENSGWE